MWGKGKRVEIHTNPLSRSMLVRIPSDYLRQKILEKSVWYVGESMFHAVQWSSSAASQAPPLESIQIWAHLTGVPLDLRHTQGLSLVAGLVGDPKETDEFTLNLVSLTLSHVKVAVDLTKPLPNVVEFMRENGEVVEVQVSYPWVPPTCSHCKELGHVSRNCLLLPPPSKTDLPAKKSANPSSSSPSPSSHPQPKLPKSSVLSLSPLAPSSSKHLLATPVLKPPIADPILNPIGSPLSPPDSFYAPSLKRPRPDPNPQLFPSFLAQLSFFSASSSSPALTLPPSDPAPALTLSNPYSVLVPDGSLRHEETID
ncbi:proline-rich protein 36-like [Raphanus sativus]|nr:proline-rich protein 36-like [Raphanus sativus]